MKKIILATFTIFTSGCESIWEDNYGNEYFRHSQIVNEQNNTIIKQKEIIEQQEKLVKVYQDTFEQREKKEKQCTVEYYEVARKCSDYNQIYWGIEKENKITECLIARGYSKDMDLFCKGEN